MDIRTKNGILADFIGETNKETSFNSDYNQLLRVYDKICNMNCYIFTMNHLVWIEPIANKYHLFPDLEDNLYMIVSSVDILSHIDPLTIDLIDAMFEVFVEFIIYYNNNTNKFA